MAGATFLTGGLFAVAAGLAVAVTSGAVTGAGASLITNPIQKFLTREHMTWADTGKDAVFGAAIGVVTGPIG